jgi:hypothetical protein
MKLPLIRIATLSIAMSGTGMFAEAASPDIETIVKALQKRQDRTKSVFASLDATVTMEMISNPRGWRGDPTVAKDGLFPVSKQVEIRLQGDLFDCRAETPDGLRHNLPLTLRDSFNGVAS